MASGQWPEDPVDPRRRGGYQPPARNKFIKCDNLRRMRVKSVFAGDLLWFLLLAAGRGKPLPYGMVSVVSVGDGAQPMAGPEL